MKFEKAIATILTAIFSLGAMSGTVLAAVTLGDYPTFLFEDGNLDAYVVVGADAATADVVGAVDLAVRLAGESTTAVTTTGAGVAVTGGKVEDLELNTALNDSAAFSSTLDDDDLAGLVDEKITIEISDVENDYDVHDELRLTWNASLETGLTADSPDEDFEENVFLEIDRNSISYYYVFDDNLKAGNYFDNASTSDPIEIKFLGKKLVISGADANTITALVGETVILKGGESVTVAGKTLTLVCTDSTSASVTVGTASETIDEENIDKLGGLEVYVKSVMNDDGCDNDRATLIVGEEARESYDDNDEYCLHEISDSAAYDACEDDPDWRWDLDLDANNWASPVIGLTYDQQLDEYDEVINLGDSLCLPYDYICIKLDSLVETDYKEYTIEADVTEDLYITDTDTTYQDSAVTIRFHAGGGGDNGFLAGGEYTDDVYIWYNDTSKAVELFYYDDSDSKIEFVSRNASTDAFKINFQDTLLGVDFTWPDTADYLNITLDTDDGEDIIIYAEPVSGTHGFSYLGHSDSDTTTALDLKYGTRDISGWGSDGENTRTQNGIIIHAPDKDTPNDKFEFEINGDESDFKANVVITGPGAVVTTAEGGEVRQVVPIKTAVAKLDTEISLPVGKDLVLVGGPAVNRLTAQAMGYTYPTYGAGITEFGSGEAYIKVYEDVLETGHQAVVVAGWEAADTRKATSVLQQFDTFATSLDEHAAVKVTSVTAAGITAAT